MAFGVFPLVKALPRRVETDGTLRCLHRGPLEIRVAIFDVALAFPLPVADFCTFDTATIRGRVAHRRKAAKSARFQPDRLGQNRPAAIDGLQLRVGGCVLQTRRNELFQSFDLLPQAMPNGQTAGDCQDVIGLRQQALELLQGQLVNLLDTEAHPGIARHDVLHPEHIGRVLPNHVRAFAQDIPHGPLGLWGDVPLGQHAQS